MESAVVASLSAAAVPDPWLDEVASDMVNGTLSASYSVDFAMSLDMYLRRSESCDQAGAGDGRCKAMRMSVVIRKSHLRSHIDVSLTKADPFIAVRVL